MASKTSETPKTIRFLRPWQGRKRGDLNSNLTPGVMQTLVDHGTAEWVKNSGNRRNKKSKRNVHSDRRSNGGTFDAE
jgi:hypothetical protein